MDKRRQERKRAVRREIFERDHYTCQGCGWVAKVPKDWDGHEQLTNGKRTLTIDHIIEKSLGGRSTRDNFRAMCNVCNVKRSIHVGKLIRQFQAEGLELEEARRQTAIKLGLPTTET